MQPEEIDRAVDAAKKFVATKMQAADLVAMVSLATNMRVDLDFTDDKEKIAASLVAYGASAGRRRALIRYHRETGVETLSQPSLTS